MTWNELVKQGAKKFYERRDDVEYVTRCKNCVHWDSVSKFCLNKNGCYGLETHGDWYCADGERKDDG